MGWTFSRFESCVQRCTRPHMRRGEKEIPGCSISDTGNRSGQVNLNSRLFHHITGSFPAAAAHSIRDRKGIYAKHCVLKRNGNAEESFRKWCDVSFDLRWRNFLLLTEAAAAAAVCGIWYDSRDLRRCTLFKERASRLVVNTSFPPTRFFFTGRHLVYFPSSLLPR